MSFINLVLILFSVASAACGQLMLRHGMDTAADQVSESGGSLPVRAATSPWIIFGLLVFGFSALAWLTVLSRVPLNVAYPFNALGFLGIVLGSAVVLHEKVELTTWIGASFVVVGLIVIVTGNQSAG